MRLQIKISNQLSYRVISLTGRFIDLSDDPDFHELIDKELQDGNSFFIIDLGSLTHMNSNGINAIVKAVKRINEAKGRVVFTQVPDHINELLSIIKLNAILEIAPSVEDGIQRLNA